MSTTKAERLMRELSPNAMTGETAAGIHFMLEDYSDPDGKIFRLTYYCTPDGEHATAWCVGPGNPWPRRTEAFSRCHLHEDGFICIGTGATRDVASSPHKLADVVKRARYWTTAYSFWRQTGRWVNPGEN